MLSIKVDEEFRVRMIANPHGTKNIRVHCAHQALSDEVYTMCYMAISKLNEKQD
jgi:hypothetical protein